MMATDVFRIQLMLIAGIFSVVALRLVSCSAIAKIPGEARQDDPYACLWFKQQNGLTVFRCCDGYFKTDAFNMTENCIECPDDVYGFYCKENCTCENGATCNRVDGSCQCSPNNFGRSCQYSCNCQNGATCLSDGSCSCAYGFYGELCDSKCLCPENQICSGQTGKCVCEDGFYGKLCLSCNCSGNEHCNPLNGFCSCRPGYYGEDCDRQCSCYNGAYCGKHHSEHCECSFGWIGLRCTDCNVRIVKSTGNSYCEDKCLHCYNGLACSFQSGDCECSPGWQGNKCDKSCDAGFHGFNCSEICNCEHGSCDHVDGSCHCENGWTGQRCEIACPKNCLVCREDICMSCKAGWTGKMCSNKCEPGLYGVLCEELCPECNCTTSCHHVNGSCPDVVRCEEQTCNYQNVRICMENPFTLECLGGWAGHLCLVRSTMTTAKDTLQFNNEYMASYSSTTRDFEARMDKGYPSLTVMLVFLAVVTGVVNGAVIVTLWYCVKRCTRSKTRDHNNDETEENIEMEDYQSTGNTFYYENIPRGSVKQSEEYQHLDFTYSQYQRLDTSSMNGSCTYISMK